MATIFENLQNDSQYKASTGLNQKEFDRLHEEFKLYYQPKAYNLYVGHLFCGSQVDFTLFKKELAQFDYAHKQVWVDLGFTGIKNYLPQEQVQIGYKKPKTKNLLKNKNYTTITCQK